MRHVRSFPLLLAVIVAACSDPSAPSRAHLRPVNALPLFAEPPSQPTTSVSSDLGPVPTQPPVGGNTAAINSCFANLVANNWRVSFAQSQTLNWNETHSPTLSIVKGEARVFFRFWAGTYQGQPLRCIHLDSTRFVRTAYAYNDLVSAPGWIYSSTDSYCWGAAPINAIGASPDCASHPAYITVQVRMDFGRNCNLGVDPANSPFNTQAYGQQITLGGTPHIGAADQQTWQYSLYSVGPAGQWGWWTANDYGGNLDPHTNGWPGSVNICSRYLQTSPSDPLYARYYNQRAGAATWSHP